MEAEVKASRLRQQMLSARLASGETLIRNQKWRLRTYSNVFVGREAVTWAMDAGLCASRAAAVLMFNSLLNSGFIEHVPKKMDFRDAFLFYTWGGQADPNTPPAATRSLPQNTAPTFARLLSGDDGRAKLNDSGGFSKMQEPAVLQELVVSFVRKYGLDAKSLQHSGYVDRQMRFKVVPNYCLLLFNESVVICIGGKEDRLLSSRSLLQRSNELKMKHLLHLAKVTPLEKTSKSFCINTPTKNFVFCVRSMEERDLWVSKLKAAVLHVRQPSNSPLDDAIIQLQSLIDCKLSQDEQVKRITSVINTLSISRAKQFHDIREETMSKVEDQEVLKFLESTFMPPPQQTHAHDTENLKPAAAMEIAMAFVVHLLRPLEKTRKIQTRCRRILHIDKLINRETKVSENERYTPPDHLNSQQAIEYSLWTFTAKFTLRKVETWDFDIFRLDACTYGRPLSTLMFHIFLTYDFFTRYNIRPVIFCNWMLELEAGYVNNPYHNRMHAADVVQNTFFFLRQTPFFHSGLSLDPNNPDPGALCALLAAAMHDYRHPGVTNPYLCATEDDLAVTYNHTSVLESMHCAEAFRLMKRPDLNIMEFFSPKLKAEVRDTVVTMVLSTDMKRHFDLVQRLHQDDASPGQPKARSIHLESVLHCADLGNPTKPRALMLQWTNRVFEEFYAQGDQERKLGLPISQMMDRTQPAVEKSQIGFIDFIVKPLFKQFIVFCPEAEVCLSNLQLNKEYWQVQIAQMEQKHSFAPNTTTTSATSINVSASPSARHVTNTSPTLSISSNSKW